MDYGHERWSVQLHPNRQVDVTLVIFAMLRTDFIRISSSRKVAMFLALGGAATSLWPVAARLSVSVLRANIVDGLCVWTTKFVDTSEGGGV